MSAAARSASRLANSPASGGGFDRPQMAIIIGLEWRLPPACAAVVDKDVDWVRTAIPGGAVWFSNTASPRSVAMWHMLGRNVPGGVVHGFRKTSRRGSNSGHVSRQEALDRLPQEATHYEAACARHVARRPRLVDLTAAERTELERHEEQCRSCLGERGKELWDRGWSVDDIVDVLNRAQAAADAAFNKCLDDATSNFSRKASA
jgi:hypothetical protein